MAKSSSTSGGIGFAGALTILFIGLKLANVITWSWVWVLSPLWLGLAAVIGIILLIATVTALVGVGQKLLK